MQVKQVQNGFVYPYPQYSKDCPIWSEIKQAGAGAQAGTQAVRIK